MRAAVAPVLALPRGLRLVLGGLVFQGAWFACVLGAAHGVAALGIACVAGAIALVLLASTAWRADAALVAIAVATGLVFDGLLAALGVVSYASPASVAAPAWILALWALWGVVLREPLQWLHGRPWVAAALGAVGGPLSYAAAARMGACSFAQPTLALATIALGWAVITPLHLAVARRLAGGRA